MPSHYDGSETVIENLRRLLYERHLTQSDLAKRAHMQRSAISLILNGTDFRMSTLFKLAKALDVDPSAIIDRVRPEVHAATKEGHHQSIIEAITTLLEAAKEK